MISIRYRNKSREIGNVSVVTYESWDCQFFGYSIKSIGYTILSYIKYHARVKSQQVSKSAKKNRARAQQFISADFFLIVAKCMKHKGNSQVRTKSAGKKHA